MSLSSIWTLFYNDIWLNAAIFFPGLFFKVFSCFCSLTVVWGLGFRGWVLSLGFWGWGFQLLGFGFGALYINIKE